MKSNEALVLIAEYVKLSYSDEWSVSMSKHKIHTNEICISYHHDNYGMIVNLIAEHQDTIGLTVYRCINKETSLSEITYVKNNVALDRVREVLDSVWTGVKV